jgi:hypothetical protein
VLASTLRHTPDGDRPQPPRAWESGRAVTWLQELRGASGILWPVDGVVVRAGPRRVLIRVRRRSGETAERWVRPDALRERPTTTLHVRMHP